MLKQFLKPAQFQPNLAWQFVAQALQEQLPKIDKYLEVQSFKSCALTGAAAVYVGTDVLCCTG